MNSDFLHSKWQHLSSLNIVKGYKSLRINSDCKSDIYLGIDTTGNHSLILSLPDEHGVEFKVVNKDKISIELFNDTNYLIMTLKDSDYYDLFDDLIISLFNAIRNIEEVNEYSKVFIKTFYQWTLFFALSNYDLLPKDLIKGIWGELIVLKNLIEDSSSIEVNNILSGWRGLYDQGHDFIYDDMNIEVKTKDVRKLTVRISNETQLEVETGKKLILSVVSVEDDVVNGASLKDLIEDIKALIFDKYGDFTIILTSILQKGITLNNIHEYDNFRFKPINLQNFDCLNEYFPKLVKSALPSGISNVKYDINLLNMSDNLISMREF